METVRLHRFSIGAPPRYDVTRHVTEGQSSPAKCRIRAVLRAECVRLRVCGFVLLLPAGGSRVMSDETQAEACSTSTCVESILFETAPRQNAGVDADTCGLRRVTVARIGVESMQRAALHAS